MSENIKSASENPKPKPPSVFANLFKQAKPAAGGALFSKAPSGVSAASYDGHSFKSVYAEGKSKFRVISACFSQTVDASQAEQLRLPLRELQRAKRWNHRNVLLANPSQLTTARVLNLPSINQKEICGMIDLQIEKIAPHGKEETVSYYEIFEHNQQGYSIILLVLAYQDAIEKASKVIEDIGGQISKVTSELQGFVNWFQIVASGQAKSTVLFADIDSETTSILVFHKGKPYFHRSIDIGYRQLSEAAAEASPEKFTAELHRSVEVFEGEGLNIKCKEVLLTGLSEHLPWLGDVIQKDLNLPVKTFSTFEKIHLSKQMAHEKSALNTVSFTSLVGLALAPSHGDLTTSRLKLQKAFEVRSKALMVLGAQALVSIVLLSFLLIEIAHKDLAKNAFLQSQSNMISKDAGQAELYMSQLAIVTKRLQKRGQLLEAINELNRLSPDAVKWNALTYTANENVILAGVSTEIPKVFEMVTGIEKTEMFGQAEAKKVAKRRVKDQDVTEFEITSPFEEVA